MIPKEPKCDVCERKIADDRTTKQIDTNVHGKLKVCPSCAEYLARKGFAA